MTSFSGGAAPVRGGSLGERRGAPARRVESPLAPVFDGESRVLILGTMPSPKSRERGFHYGNPQNRFWRVVSALWDEDVPTTDAERRGFCARHRIALDDVLSSCTIAGASDASIADPVPNDLRARVLDHAPIRTIFCTGATSHRLYRALIEPELGIAATRLPSTSPANAAWSLERLVAAYRVVREAAEGSLADA